ncbi:uncharacterized protein BDV14DRAFT_135866 [Aspergillus stella-maris]|uniref:uncharacterized protein n=1 Tax=Aspergillus stella-maris TaxID=1810926 RepID=UPI003CCDD207
MSTTMDLSKLTRPAILCQCSQCLSSLAVLENDWVKLSNSYSVVAGWLSIQLHRISISPDKKQVPHSSELSLIRGRIVQEIGCKLCKQKLGVLCDLDNGPNVFWKLSKVSLLEIVTMRTVDAVFNDKDGVLEDLLFPKPKTLFRLDGVPAQPGALVPTDSNEVAAYDISVEHQIQQQGVSLDHISSSVSNLHDTMHELKNAFTAMRIELNGPSRLPNEHDFANPNFNMVSTVLKELKSKADEIEKLKLEIEALKFRNRYVEEHTARQALPTLTVEAPIPEVASPGLLQGSRKRPYPFPEHYQGGRERPVADSFDDPGDEDSMVDFSLEETSAPSVRVPLKTNGTEPEPPQDLSSSRSPPRLQIEVGHTLHHTPPTLSADEPAAKRQRLSSNGTASSGAKKPRGRPPRKSLSQNTQPDTTSTTTTKSVPLNENNGNNTYPPTDQNQQRTRSRSKRGRSRASSPNTRHKISTENPETNGETPSQQDIPLNNNTPPQPTTHPVVELGKKNTTNGDKGTTNKVEMNEKRKAQSAARDHLAKLAMQREEAMDTEEAR